MEREPTRDPGDEQAVWRDLVARLELPSPVDPANPPWPQRESLGPAGPAAPAVPAAPVDGEQGAHPQSTNGAGPSTAARPADNMPQQDTSGAPGTPGQSHQGNSQPPVPANRSRIIRPARSVGSAVSPQEHQSRQEHEPSPDPSGQLVDPAHRTADRPADRGVPPTGELMPGWNFGPFAGPAPQFAARNNLPSDGARSDAAWAEFDDQGENADDRYVPPHIPPLPKIDPVARGAWTAVIGGPGYLFIATTLGWEVPGWAQLAAIIAFIAGFVILVSRLGDGPSRRDGPDQGAVV